ncbi:MAG: universal stress protein [Pseudomonadota bacterium]
MGNIKRIMVALDLSPYSREVLDYAAEVVANTGADLVILNVINKRDIDAAKHAISMEHPGGFSITKYLQDDMGRRSRQIDDLIREIFPDPGHIRTTFRDGNPVEEIVNAITEEKADFVIIGHKGRSDRPGISFGSTAEKVFKHSPVPVLSIRPPPTK